MHTSGERLHHSTDSPMVVTAFKLIDVFFATLVTVILYTASHLPAQSTSTYTFNPTDDAYVRDTLPTENMGWKPHIRVQNSSSLICHGYYKFDVAGLNGTVVRATIRLYVVDEGADGGSVYLVSNDYKDGSGPWKDRGIVWNNAPPITGSPLSTVGSVQLDSLVHFDVTLAITGNGTYSFGFSNTTGARIKYSSKEGVYLPELIIETDSTISIPKITSFTPTSGPVGTVVSIVGSDFKSTRNVFFNSVSAANFTVDSDSLIRAEAPAGATTGKISIINAVGVDSSLTDFVVIQSNLTFTFNPTDDAFVRSTQPLANFGQIENIRIQDGNPKFNGYLKFKVTGLNAPVERAVIRLYVVDESVDGGLIYSVSNDYNDGSGPWQNDGIVWDNAPPINGAPTSAIDSVSLNTWAEVDVTSAISGNGVYSFGLLKSTGDRVKYSSRESSNPPELVIETSPATSINDENRVEPLPDGFTLYQPYPNPFNAQTTIAYAFPHAASVHLVIFNHTGQEVRELVDEFQSAGHKRIVWDGKGKNGRELSSGVYFVRLTVGKVKLMRQITILK